MVTRPSLQIDNHADHSVVSLLGEFDLDVADSLRDALAVAVYTHHRVVVDLTTCEFMDSVTLGCLVLAAKTARTAGGWVRLAGPNRSLRRVLVLTGLEEMLSVHDSVAQATADLTGSSVTVTS